MADLPQVPGLPGIPELIVPQVSTPAPYFVAMVIDGVVHTVMNLDGQDAARFLSNPKFVQVNTTDAPIGFFYDEATNTFSNPLETNS